jgi:phosphate starvation-inducible PhoH-like protein
LPLITVLGRGEFSFEFGRNEVKGVEIEVRVEFPENQLANALFGQTGEHLKIIARDLDVRIHARGNAVRIQGDEPDVTLVEDLLRQLYGIIKKGHPIYEADIGYAARILSQDRKAKLEDVFLDTIFISTKNKVITPKSTTQKGYVDEIRGHDIVVGIGPAGTGKTYLAMAMAVSSLLRKEVHRIILTRPAVEAGEKLGFLPGDLYEKVNPYLRPLYDALHDMMDFEQASTLIQRGEVEVAPLAFMRGRTLNDSFVILDEAQNTTSEQMKMFLTRLGFGSKAVVTGDITQIDLPSGSRSGLIEIAEVLKDIDGIGFVYFSERDVVRHPLVQDIIRAYEGVDRHEKGDQAS